MKGRPPLEPRIAALEREIAALRHDAGLLKAQLADMQDAFNRGVLPRPQSRYESLFTVWPGAAAHTSNT